MERSYLICGLIGQFCAENQSMDSTDLKIKIDQVLTASGFTILGTEEDDTQLLDEMIGEFQMSLIGRKFNRNDRRK